MYILKHIYSTLSMSITWFWWDLLDFHQNQKELQSSYQHGKDQSWTKYGNLILHLRESSGRITVSLFFPSSFMYTLSFFLSYKETSFRKRKISRQKEIKDTPLLFQFFCLPWCTYGWFLIFFITVSDYLITRCMNTQILKMFSNNVKLSLRLYFISDDNMHNTFYLHFQVNASDSLSLLSLLVALLQK